MDFDMFFLGSAVVLSALLTINFFYLVFKYNKEKFLPIQVSSEKELLDKYGPILCACILEKRGVKSRDVIAILVKLIQNDIVQISSKRVTENGVIINKYKIKYVNKKAKLSDEEQDVIDMFFIDGNDECILNEELAKIDSRKETFKKHIAEKLEKFGINTVKVSKKTRIMNTVFFILVCVFFIIHLFYSFDEKYFFKNLADNVINWLVILIRIDGLFILFIAFVKAVTLVFERFRAKSVNGKIELADRSIISVFLRVVFANLIVLVLLVFAGSNYNFIADIILFDFAVLVLVADEIFVTHSPRMAKDYMSIYKFAMNLKEGTKLEYFIPSEEEKLKEYIPFLICADLRDANPSDYIKKAMDITLDSDEHLKYANIYAIMELNEPKIEKFYFLDSF